MPKKTFECSDRIVEMLEDLRQETGEDNISGVIRRAISEFHAKLFPQYVKAKNRIFSPEEEQYRSDKKEQLRRETTTNKQRMICERLEGTVEQSGTGFVCRYYNYSPQGKFEQVLPLDHLTPELIDQQYYPDKETVLKAKKK